MKLQVACVNMELQEIKNNTKSSTNGSCKTLIS